jgi:Asp-tRNA(Asn)/Glu-tRNA(Gln) amidotransferase B subunit
MRDGDMNPVGFLVGQVMKATGGKADPRKVSELIRAAGQTG